VRDEPLVREGIVHVLAEADMDVVGAAGDATTLLDQVRRHRPDVVVTDIQCRRIAPMTGCGPHRPFTPPNPSRNNSRIRRAASAGANMPTGADEPPP